MSGEFKVGEGNAKEGQTFARYRDLQFLGQGGMGRVYRAFDPVLKRFVALKFLREEEPEVVERFLAEARAQARVQHPNVCRIYEAGEAEGRRYIAMQLLTGKPLTDTEPALALREKVEVMIDVASAVHTAHRAGLIHRDLKPANILLERNEDGAWMPYVMDFGLAREIHEPGLTATGVIVGSPPYMPPEQVVGSAQTLDRRTDVYSLGVTCYEFFCGKLPLEASTTVELLMKVLNEEPVPLRRRLPAVDSDLETIVMKCLEKEPERRYDSARALAEDLSRYLDGEPIAARRTSTVFRILSKTRKHKRIAAGAGVALLLICLSAGWALRSNWNAERQAEAAQLFGRQVQDVEHIMREAYLLPLHDIRPEKQLVRARMGQIEAAMKELGTAGEGPGRAALGRGYLALQDYRKAKEYLERAWAGGYRPPDVAASLGIACGELYRGLLQEAERISDENLRKQKLQEARTRYGNSALEFLRIGNPERPEYARVLLAYYERDWPRALRLMEGWKERSPEFYQGIKLKGDVEFSIAQENRLKGQYQPAFEAYAKARAEYLSALEIARSDPSLHQALCDAWSGELDADTYSGQSYEEASRKAEESCGRALVADPENAAALDRLSVNYFQIADDLLYHGGNPQEALDRCIRYAEQSIRIDPHRADPHRNTGVAISYIAKQEATQGKDPRETWKKAYTHFQQAISIDPGSIPAQNSFGVTLLDQADYEFAHGLDPRETLRQSASSLQKALNLAPTYAVPAGNMGVAYLYLGRYESSRGLDPKTSLRKAVESFEAALRINPRDPYYLNDLGQVYDALTTEDLLFGRDPSSTIEKAVESYRKAIEITPDYSYPHGNLGIAMVQTAIHALETGGDPESHLAAAAQHFSEALRIQPDLLFVVFWRGRASIVEAKWLLEQKKSPLEALKSARTWMQKSLKLDPSSAASLVFLAQADLLEYRFRADRELLRRARKSLETAIRMNEREPEAYTRLAELCGMEAQADHNPERLREGLANVEKALSSHPAYPEALAQKARLQELLGNPEANRSWEKAISLNPWMQRLRERS